MDTIDTTAITEPERWNIVFSTKVSKWWIAWLAAGRFKHVWAFCYVAPSNCWVIYDVHLAGTRIAVIPDNPDNRTWLGRQIADCEMISMPRRSGAGGIRVGLWCVTAVKHLVGIRSSALRPDALWTYCLRNGGEVIARTRPPGTAAASA